VVPGPGHKFRKKKKGGRTEGGAKKTKGGSGGGETYLRDKPGQRGLGKRKKKKTMGGKEKRGIERSPQQELKRKIQTVGGDAKGKGIPGRSNQKVKNATKGGRISRREKLWRGKNERK